MPSLPTSEEVLRYAHTVQVARRACCGALYSENCGAARSLNDSVDCVDPVHDCLQGNILEQLTYVQGSDGFLAFPINSLALVIEEYVQ